VWDHSRMLFLASRSSFSLLGEHPTLLAIIVLIVLAAIRTAFWYRQRGR
jgi:hypothetical protein